MHTFHPVFQAWFHVLGNNMYRAKNDNLRNQNSTDREFQVFRELQVDTMAYFELFHLYNKFWLK